MSPPDELTKRIDNVVISLRLSRRTPSCNRTSRISLVRVHHIGRVLSLSLFAASINIFFFYLKILRISPFSAESTQIFWVSQMFSIITFWYEIPDRKYSTEWASLKTAMCSTSQWQTYCKLSTRWHWHLDGKSFDDFERVVFQKQRMFAIWIEIFL